MIKKLDQVEKHRRYHQRFYQPILNYSQSQDLNYACKEWLVIDVHYKENHDGVCLCGKDNLYLCYTIYNPKTNVKLGPIGSHCIGHFDSNFKKIHDIIAKLYNLNTYRTSSDKTILTKNIDDELIYFLEKYRAISPNKYNKYNTFEDYSFLRLAADPTIELTDKQVKKAKAIIATLTDFLNRLTSNLLIIANNLYAVQEMVRGLIKLEDKVATLKQLALKETYSYSSSNSWQQLDSYEQFAFRQTTTKSGDTVVNHQEMHYQQQTTVGVKRYGGKYHSNSDDCVYDTSSDDSYQSIHGTDSTGNYNNYGNNVINGSNGGNVSNGNYGKNVNNSSNGNYSSKNDQDNQSLTQPLLQQFHNHSKKLFVITDDVSKVTPQESDQQVVSYSYQLDNIELASLLYDQDSSDATKKVQLLTLLKEDLRHNRPFGESAILAFAGVSPATGVGDWESLESLKNLENLENLENLDNPDNLDSFHPRNNLDQFNNCNKLGKSDQFNNHNKLDKNDQFNNRNNIGKSDTLNKLGNSDHRDAINHTRKSLNTPDPQTTSSSRYSKEATTQATTQSTTSSRNYKTSTGRNERVDIADLKQKIHNFKTKAAMSNKQEQRVDSDKQVTKNSSGYSASQATVNSATTSDLSFLQPKQTKQATSAKQPHQVDQQGYEATTRIANASTVANSKLQPQDDTVTEFYIASTKSSIVIESKQADGNTPTQTTSSEATQAKATQTKTVRNNSDDDLAQVTTEQQQNKSPNIIKGLLNIVSNLFKKK